MPSLFSQAANRVLTNAQRVQSLILPNRKGNGIKVNHENPQYTWRDLEGEIRPREVGVGAPALTVFRDSQRQYAFVVNDIVDITFHWPHDIVPGSEAYIHTHWGHNGTSISGSLVLSYRHTYAKGHGVYTFPADKTLTHTISGLTISNAPQYVHRIDEIRLVAPSGETPTANEYSADNLEVDGILLVSLQVTGVPTISGGGSTRPFLFYSDIHYLSTNIGTLNRAPDFYLPT